MPTKVDYLRDLRANPRSTSAEVLPHVQAPTLGAVETAFRKYADAGLVESDKSAPKRYTLTEKGTVELEQLESGAQTASVLESSPSLPMLDLGILLGQFAAFGDLARRLAKQTEIQGQSPSSPKTLSSEEESPKSHRARALLERVRAHVTGSELDAPAPDAPATSVPWDNPKVQQLYALQLGMSDLPRRIVRGRKDALAAIAGNEVSELVAQLVQAEQELRCELDDTWWPDKKKSDGLQQEIAELRRKLGCSGEVAEDSSNGDE